MPADPAAVRLIADLAKVLEHWGRWYVFGAQAVVAYGVPRLSADVDVTLALDPDEPERFTSEMRSAGFELRVEDPDFVRRTRVMPFVHLPTAMPLDIYWPLPASRSRSWNARASLSSEARRYH